MRELVAAIARERIVFINLFLLVVTVGVFVGFVIGTVYTAEARLLILSGHDSDIKMDNDANEQPYSNSATAGAALTEAELIWNRPLVQNTVEHIGLSALYPGLWKRYQDVRLPYGSLWALKLKCLVTGSGIEAEYEKLLMKRRAKWFDRAVARFVKAFRVRPVADSNIIILQFKHKDPVIAAAAVHTLLKLYLERRRQLYAPMSYSALITQQDTLAEQLHATEQELVDFRLRHHTGSYVEEKSLLLRQMEELSANRIHAETLLGETEARINVLYGQIQAVPKVIPEDRSKVDISPDSQAAMEKTLESLEASRREFLSKYTARNPAVRNVEGKIQALRHYLETNRTKPPGPIEADPDSALDRLTTEMNRLITNAASLRQQQASLTARQESVRTRLQDHARIENDYNRQVTQRDLLSDKLKIYSAKLEEARIREEMERKKLDNVRIIQEPTPPQIGVNMVKVMSVIAVFIGGFLALISAVARDYYRQSLDAAKDHDRPI